MILIEADEGIHTYAYILTEYSPNQRSFQSPKSATHSKPHLWSDCLLWDTVG
jgi:hypothetical protein